MATCVVECGSFARIYKQGPILAICNTSLLKIPKFIFYQHMRPKSGLKFPRPFLDKPQSTEAFDYSVKTYKNCMLIPCLYILCLKSFE